MSISRRELLCSSAAAVSLAAGPLPAAAPAPAVRDRSGRRFFNLHPLIEANPKAVFIRRTKVPHKMDEEAKRREGLDLARQIFVASDTSGVPISHRVLLKPNQCSVRNQRPHVENWGTGTDPQFYEGMIMGLQELGLKKFHFLEANNFNTWNWRGFNDINDKLGVEMNEPDRRVRNFLDDFEMNWHKVPDAVVYARIPHYAPIGEPDTWMLNIAKWKAHGMCLSQSVKNEQGLCVKPFVRFCPGWRMATGVPEWMKPYMNPNVERDVNRFFDRHIKLGYSRYQSRADLGPIHQEIWAHKTCDNMSVLKTDLAMIEGIYSRDGDGFGIGHDYLTNLVMFGKDKFRLDLVGLHLGGHEPGNVNLYRTAKERGLTDTFNPWDVPIFEWLDDGPVARKLTDFERTPLKTYYLQKDNEPLFHLVNEPFDYDRIKL